MDGSPDVSERSPGCSTPWSQDEEILPRNSIYNFPNQPIEIQAQGPKQSASEGHRGDLACVSSVPKAGNVHHFLGNDFFDAEEQDPLWFLRSQDWTFTAILLLFVKVFCFVPWCIAVGGAMHLFPDQLEEVAFQTGYIDTLQGIRRFAHWAKLGVSFVMTFSAFVLCLLWFVPIPFGMALAFSLCARFAFVWKGFRVDHSVPLGEDDRQSIYVIAVLGERGLIEMAGRMTRTEVGFVLLAN